MHSNSSKSKDAIEAYQQYYRFNMHSWTMWPKILRLLADHSDLSLIWLQFLWKVVNHLDFHLLINLKKMASGDNDTAHSNSKPYPNTSLSLVEK